MRKIVKAILHFLVLIVYRVKKVGEKNLPKDGKYIIFANHVHALDAVAMVVTSRRKIIMIAKEELFKNPIIAWLGRTFEVIPIKRGTGDIDAMKKSIKALKNGDVIGIFPEGTRNGMKKGVKFHNGGTLMALKTGTKIIPVGIQGSFKPFTKVKYNYGKPMDFSQYEDQKSDKEVLNIITNEVMQEVIRLTNEKI